MITFWKRPDRAKSNEVENSLERLRDTQEHVECLKRWAEENHFFEIVVTGVGNVMKRETGNDA